MATTKEYQKEYYRKNKKKRDEYNRTYLENLSEDQKEHRKKYIREATKKYYWKVRKDVIKHYGNKCECCKESRFEFLAIDHVDGGGVKHLREIKSRNLAVWIFKNNYPTGFRILCHNCNMALGFYGYCPHQKRKTG